jgi:hypothetical protein
LITHFKTRHDIPKEECIDRVQFFIKAMITTEVENYDENARRRKKNEMEH